MLAATCAGHGAGELYIAVSIALRHIDGRGQPRSAWETGWRPRGPLARSVTLWPCGRKARCAETATQGRGRPAAAFRRRGVVSAPAPIDLRGLRDLGGLRLQGGATLPLLRPHSAPPLRSRRMGGPPRAAQPPAVFRSSRTTSHGVRSHMACGQYHGCHGVEPERWDSALQRT